MIEGHVLKDACAAQLRMESHLLAGDDLIAEAGWPPLLELTLVTYSNLLIDGL